MNVAWPLVPHPLTSSQLPVSVMAGLQVAGDGVIEFCFEIRGAIDRIRRPTRQPAERRDELWRHTCFEAFIALADGSSYVEHNWSPSGAWALYAFSDYRRRLPDPAVCAPRIVIDWRDDVILCRARPEPTSWPSRIGAVGLAVVIEAVDGAILYHAIRHPRATPDFHDAGGFVPWPWEHTA